MPRALLVYETTGAGDLVRPAILKEGCLLEERPFTGLTVPQSIEPYRLVVVEIARFGRPLLEVLRTWHEERPPATVILIGSRTTTANRIAALEAGVSAYLKKPLIAAEFAARVRAAMRQVHVENRRLPQVSFGGGVIDLEARVVVAPAGRFGLTPTECAILKHLVQHLNQTVSCGHLVELLWGAGTQKGAHSLRLFIRKLRVKLEPDPKRPRYLLTDPRVGYRLQV